MWGTSSPDDKLTGDLGNVIEATQIGGRRSDCLLVRKLSSSNFGLLQQYRGQSGHQAAQIATDKITYRTPIRAEIVLPLDAVGHPDQQTLRSTIDPTMRALRAWTSRFSAPAMAATALFPDHSGRRIIFPFF
jgi:hypothetical protein